MSERNGRDFTAFVSKDIAIDSASSQYAERSKMLACNASKLSVSAGTNLHRSALPSSRAFCAQSGFQLPRSFGVTFLTKIESLRSKAPIAAARRNQTLVCMASSIEKTVLVPIGEGSEEMEAVTIIDVMRRAGASVTVASVESSPTVCCSRNVKIVADALMTEVAEEQYDLIVLPVSMHANQQARSFTLITACNAQIMNCRAARQDLRL